jgi:hypothetical protein
MVRPRVIQSFDARAHLRRFLPVGALGIWLSGLLFLGSGCAMAPRAQMEECQQLSRTLRTENTRLKDQLLVVQARNRDYADRSLDDSRRLADQDEAIERLERSVHAYQDERAQLESAYHQLAASLGDARVRTDDRESRASLPATAKKQPRRESTTAAASAGEDRDRVQ